MSLPVVLCVDARAALDDDVDLVACTIGFAYDGSYTSFLTRTGKCSHRTIPSSLRRRLDCTVETTVNSEVPDEPRHGKAEAAAQTIKGNS